MESLFSELKRRNVFKVGITYLALGWVAIQVTETAVSALNLPESLRSIVFYLGIIGFPFALLFAWAFEMTPEGVKRTKDIAPSDSIVTKTGNALEHVIVGLLSVAVIFLLWGQLKQSPDTAATNPAPEISAIIAKPLAKSIAVLPFVNMSADKEQEYFSDGISEEILNVLAKVPNLHVTSRSSAFAYKGKDLDLTKVANQLGVNHILEGSVRKSGAMVRITAQLIEAGTDKHLWSETYDRELVDIFAIQDEISGAIVTALKVKLFGAAKPTAALKAPSINSEAYMLYLKGLHIFMQGDDMADIERSRELLERSIALAPLFAPVHAIHSRVLNQLASNAFIPLGVGGAMARAAADRAIAIDPNYALGYTARGDAKSAFDFDFAGARNDALHALSLNSNDAEAHRLLSGIYTTFGEFEKALIEGKKALVLDPLDRFTMSRESKMLYLSGRYGEALKAIDLALSLNPNDQGIFLNKAYIHVVMGDYKLALDVAAKLKDEAFRPQVYAMAYHGLGDKVASDAALAEIIKVASDNSAYQIAEIYCFRGEVGECLDWLETSYKQRDPGMQAIIPAEFLKPVRGEERYLAILKLMGLDSIK